MKIEHIKGNTYRVRKVIKGKRYTVYFDHKPTDKEVMMVMSEKLQNADYGKNNGTFEQYCDKYIDAKREVLSPSTIGGYQKCKRCISAEFKAKRLYDITQIDVQQEVSRYARNCRNLS